MVLILAIASICMFSPTIHASDTHKHRPIGVFNQHVKKEDPRVCEKHDDELHYIRRELKLIREMRRFYEDELKKETEGSPAWSLAKETLDHVKKERRDFSKSRDEKLEECLLEDVELEDPMTNGPDERLRGLFFLKPSKPLRGAVPEMERPAEEDKPEGNDDDHSPKDNSEADTPNESVDQPQPAEKKAQSNEKGDVPIENNPVGFKGISQQKQELLERFKQVQGSIGLAWASGQRTIGGIVNTGNDLLGRLENRRQSFMGIVNSSRSTRIGTNNSATRYQPMTSSTYGVVNSVSTTVVENPQLSPTPALPPTILLETGIDNGGQTWLGAGPGQMQDPKRDIYTGPITLTNEPKSTGEVLINQGKRLDNPVRLNTPSLTWRGTAMGHAGTQEVFQ